MNSTVIVSRLAGAVAVAFGVLTIVSGGSALRGDVDMGAVVPFVLWFNTIAGPVYILAGVGLWFRKRWTFAVSLAIFVATVVVFVGLGLFIASGGNFEMRTVYAMTFRTVFLGLLALIAKFVTNKIDQY